MIGVSCCLEEHLLYSEAPLFHHILPEYIFESNQIVHHCMQQARWLFILDVLGQNEAYSEVPVPYVLEVHSSSFQR